MNVRDAFIAVDWGTTNRRAYRINAAGAVTETERDDRGILAVDPRDFAGEATALRARFDGLPMLCAGMVGSNRGWREVPYVPCPATLADLARGTLHIEPDVAVVPGVSLVEGGRADVMRGEEVQLLGAVAAGLTPPDALLCQPGTHCKWATMEGGRLVRFTTAMTGELFALLRRHSLLSAQLDGEVADGPAFADGLQEAARGDLLASLFGARPALLLGLRSHESSASFVSGLLIGSDVAPRLREGPREVHILADPAMGALYARAILTLGGAPHLVDSHAAFVAGIVRIWESLQ